MGIEHNHHTVSDATWVEYYPQDWIDAANQGGKNPYTGKDYSKSKWQGKFNSVPDMLRIENYVVTDENYAIKIDNDPSSSYSVYNYHNLEYFDTVGPGGKQKELPTPSMWYTAPEVIPGWNDIHSPFFWVNVFISFPLPVRLVQAFQQSIDHQQHRIVPGAIKNKAYVAKFNSGKWSWNTPRGQGYYPIGAAALQWELDVPTAEINWMEFVTARQGAVRTFQSVFLDNVFKLQGRFLDAPDTNQVRIQRLACYVFSHLLMQTDKALSPNDWVLLCKVLDNALSGYDTFIYGQVGFNEIPTLKAAREEDRKTEAEAEKQAAETEGGL